MINLLTIGAGGVGGREGGFGLEDGRGENWTGGRLRGDEVRFVKGTVALGAMFPRRGLGGAS